MAESIDTWSIQRCGMGNGQMHKICITNYQQIELIMTKKNTSKASKPTLKSLKVKDAMPAEEFATYCAYKSVETSAVVSGGLDVKVDNRTERWKHDKSGNWKMVSIH